MPHQKKTTFCRICEALCGLEVDVQDNRIVSIRADEHHVVTRGFGCTKGLKQDKLYDSPDRLRQPLKRHEDAFEPVSWQQGMTAIGAEVARIRREHGPDSIAMYVGTAAGFGTLHPMFAQGFMTGLGSKSMYSPATQDCSNKFAVSRHVYGFPFTQAFPDIDNTNCLIVVGANPVVSKWSFLQVSNPARRLKAIEERGGKLYFVDPRRTESAKVAGEHVAIRPGTDVFFYLAFLSELIVTGEIDREKIARFTSGFEEIERLALPWSPERCAEVTRIPASKLREMVSAYCDADGAALYSSTGVNMGGNGVLAFWLQEVINAVSGNLDRRGGTLVGRGIIDFPRFAVKRGLLMRSDRSRIGGYTAVNDTFPGGILADEILTPGDSQVRALFVTGGNPLLTMANSGRLRQAFEKLELLVVIDLFLNETASLAHYVLPATSPFERPDLPFIFPLMLGLQSEPYLQATERMIDADGEQRDEATIYLDLARASGVNIFGSRLAQWSLEQAKRRHSKMHPQRQPSIPQEALLSMILRFGGEGGFRRLLRARRGRLRPGHRDNDFLGKRVVTVDGLVHLAPPELVEKARDLGAVFEAEKERATELRLITRRAVTSHNSWTHNLGEFVAADRSSNYLYMSPDDARGLGLGEGDLADVESATATVRVPVKLLADLTPGTVALPHGWGHQHAQGLAVASKTTGVNANLLAADGPHRLERISGMAHLTAIPVSVRPAEGPRNDDSWSGISQH